MEEAALKGVSPHVLTTRGLVSAPVQIIWKYPYADERYVTEKAWQSATLEECPFHPRGGCGLEKLGSYGRVRPNGVRVARFWCPLRKASISLLPSFVAARFGGTLAEVEAVVNAVEKAGSIAGAVDAVHPAEAEDAIGLDGALRSIRRRVRAVSAALRAIATLLPEFFMGVAPTVTDMRASLGTSALLVALRSVAERHLPALPAPLGFAARAAA